MRSLMIISILIAMTLSIMPLPELLQHYRPDWVALVVLWGNIHHSNKFNVGSAWIIGIAMDLINATILGQYALTFTVTSYLAIRINLQFQLFSLLQKGLTILLLMIIFRMLLFWIFSISGSSIDLAHYWKPLISDLLVWPWLSAMLREISQRIARSKVA